MIYVLLSIIIIQSITTVLLVKFILNNFQLTIDEIREFVIEEEVRRSYE